MEIIQLDDNYKNIRPISITLGNFDGMHIGHQQLLEKVVKLSRETKTKSSILLFDNHTSVQTEHKIEQLTSIKDKLQILSHFPIDLVFVLPFTKKIQSLSPFSFVSSVLIEQLDVKKIIVGQDYRYGYKASGTVKDLIDQTDDHRVQVIVLPDKVVNRNKVSSTMIRNLLKNGCIEEANHLLGRPYEIEGTVVMGNQRGAAMGFPTANLDFTFKYLIPGDGVYITQTEVGSEKYYSLTNIGNNPTFPGDHQTVETYIRNFSRNIYGETVRNIFLKKLRDDYKFESKEALIEQMKRDEEQLIHQIKLYNSTKI